jgi:hypothetical protein
MARVTFGFDPVTRFGRTVGDLNPGGIGGADLNAKAVTRSTDGGAIGPAPQAFQLIRCNRLFDDFDVEIAGMSVGGSDLFEEILGCGGFGCGVCECARVGTMRRTARVRRFTAAP